MLGSRKVSEPPDVIWAIKRATLVPGRGSVVVVVVLLVVVVVGDVGGP